MHTTSRLGRRGVTVILVVALGLIGWAVVHSYQNHSGVRLRALHSLEAGTGNGQSPASGGNGSDNRSGPTSTPGGAPVSGGALPTGPSVGLPIGAVDINPPAIGDDSSSSGGDAPQPTSGSGGDGSGPTTAPTPTDVSVAILTPLISSSKFGATVGFLLACNTAAGTISAAAAQIHGLSAVLSPVLSAISPACGKLSDSAVVNLDKLNKDIGVLQAADPMTAPYFAALNTVFAQMNVIAPQLPPLAGLIEALGPLVDFFQGTPSSPAGAPTS